MRKQLLHDYFRFGYNYHLLRLGKTGTNIEGVIISIKEFFGFITELNLEVTANALAAEGLQKFYEKFNERINRQLYDANKGVCFN